MGFTVSRVPDIVTICNLQADIANRMEERQKRLGGVALVALAHDAGADAPMLRIVSRYVPGVSRSR